jgi:nitroreductase
MNRETIPTETIISALNWRYAGKIFDTTKKLTEEQLHTILETGRLSPSAYGVESWQFIVVNNIELRQKLRAASYDQSKVTDASHLIVIASRIDGENVAKELVERTAKTQGKSIEELKGLSDMVLGFLERQSEERAKNWLKSQSYIPLGVMIETAALIGVDAGPMEGFNADEVEELLGLKEKNLHAATMLALGFRGDDAYAKLPKTRKSYDEVVTIIN